jgi:tetratricopeptide (TPR) repeat protein
MYEMKRLSQEAIPAALARAERYRLLNEPEQAESICLDVLATDPANQLALIALILSLTEQFGRAPERLSECRDLLRRLQREYDRLYYAGLICERRARALLESGRPGSGTMAYDGYQEAMTWYEKAEAIRRPGNDDAVLRWNTCARFLNLHPHLAPSPEERSEPMLLE